MKQNNEINVFSISIKTWLLQILNMSIFVAIAMLILIFCINVLKIDAIASYGIYVKFFILALTYIGILAGTHRSFKDFSKYKTYIPKSVKYIILIFQLIFFSIFTYAAILIKLDVVYFIGIYLTLFAQFIFNTIYLYLNNRKYPKININRTKRIVSKENPNNFSNKKDSHILDIDKLQ